MTPEQKARVKIDELLTAAGWDVQNRDHMNLWAQPGVAVREAHLKTGFADYLLFVDGKALGVVEAKKVGTPLSGVEAQSKRYATGLQPHMQAWRPDQPLPFRYESTGIETYFTNALDPEPRSRRVLAFHQPHTLGQWAQEETTLRGRLTTIPPLPEPNNLWEPQVEAIQNLEQSLAHNRPRALIQMATGSGKTFTAVNFIYRLIRYANARRVLFLVDRSNLGRQAFAEFDQFETPDDGRKFSELYNIRHLTSSHVNPELDVNRVYISTIQRLYAMIRDEELDVAVEERSLFEWDESGGRGGSNVGARLALPSNEDDTHDVGARLALPSNEDDTHDVGARLALPSNEDDTHDVGARLALPSNEDDTHDVGARLALPSNMDDTHDVGARLALPSNMDDTHDVGARLALPNDDDPSSRVWQAKPLQKDDPSIRVWQAKPLQGDGPIQTVSYTPRLPIEFFDFIVIDESHRSIYTVWRQVLEYFDAFHIGLTATPGKQTLAFFNQNLVQDYSHEKAVADGINVGGEVYKILTRISDEGSQVEKGYYVDKMDKLTRDRWSEKLDEDLVYGPEQLDRDVVSEGQIRTIIRHFRDVLFSELFPDRDGSNVPKTLIFAKDDNHAENIVRIAREEFGKGNDFCQKITYRAERNPEEILQDFRIGFHPRIAVTVDMIATGTDVRSIEILIFMRQVRSRGYFEQMRGRGTRIVTANELQGVTADAAQKTHFVLIDAVGLSEAGMIETTRTLEKKRTVPFDKLLEQIGYGTADEETVSSLAGRLARLQHRLNEDDEKLIADYSDGRTLPELIHPLLDALELDHQLARAAEKANLPPDADWATALSEEEIAAAAQELLWEATAVLRTGPNLRQTLIDIHRRSEIVIDQLSIDEVKTAGFDAAATESLRNMIGDFRRFIEENKDEITALEILYSRPYGQARLTRTQLKELAEAIKRPPYLWTEEKLWRAYAQLERDRVRGVGQQRVLTDLIALVRHALNPDGELAPYPAQVRARYDAWLAAQEQAGKAFTAEQRWWLDKIAEFIGLNLRIDLQDFEVDGEFVNKGGRWGAMDALGADWLQIVEEMNAELVV